MPMNIGNSQREHEAEPMSREQLGQKRCPVRHHLAPLGKHAAASIGPLDSAPDLVGERYLGHVARIVGFLGSPVSKRRSDPVWTCLGVGYTKLTSRHLGHFEGRYNVTKFLVRY